MSAAPAPRALLAVLLALALGGGASALCLAVDLCTGSATPTDSDVPGPSCHAAPDHHRRGDDAGDEAGTAGLTSGSRDDCCSVRADQLDVKVGRERHASGRTTLAVAGRELGADPDGTPRDGARTAARQRSGASPPAYTLHSALLL